MSADESTRRDAAEFSCNQCLIALKFFEEEPASSSTRSSRPPQKGYLTECHHVLCHNCRVKGNTRCYKCNVTTRFMEIGPGMPPQFQSMFRSLSSNMVQLKTALQFQRGHKKILNKANIDKGRYIAQKFNEEKAREAELMKERDVLVQRRDAVRKLLEKTLAAKSILLAEDENRSHERNQEHLRTIDGQTPRRRRSRNESREMRLDDDGQTPRRRRSRNKSREMPLDDDTQS